MISRLEECSQSVMIFLYSLMMNHLKAIGEASKHNRLRVIYSAWLCCFSLTAAFFLEFFIIAGALFLGTAAFLIESILWSLCFITSIFIYPFLKDKSGIVPRLMAKIRGVKTLQSLILGATISFFIQIQNIISGQNREISINEYLPFKIFFALSDFFTFISYKINFQFDLTDSLCQEIPSNDFQNNFEKNNEIDIARASPLNMSMIDLLKEQTLNVERKNNNEILKNYFLESNPAYLTSRFCGSHQDFLSLSWGEQIVFFSHIAQDIFKYSGAWADMTHYSAHTCTDIATINEDRSILYKTLRGALLHCSEISKEETSLSLGDLDTAYNVFSKKIEEAYRLKKLGVKPKIEDNYIANKVMRIGIGTNNISLRFSPYPFLTHLYQNRYPLTSNIQEGCQNYQQIILPPAFCEKEADFLRPAIEKSISILILRGVSVGFLKVLIDSSGSKMSATPYLLFGYVCSCFFIEHSSSIRKADSFFSKDYNFFKYITKSIMFFLPRDIRDNKIVFNASLWRIFMIGPLILGEDLMNRTRGQGNRYFIDSLLNAITVYHIASFIAPKRIPLSTISYDEPYEIKINSFHEVIQNFWNCSQRLTDWGREVMQNKKILKGLAVTSILSFAHFINERRKSSDSTIAGAAMLFTTLTFWAPTTLLFSQIDRYIESIKIKRDRIYPKESTTKNLPLPSIPILWSHNKIEQNNTRAQRANLYPLQEILIPKDYKNNK